MAVDRARGAITFPEAGEGVVLRFRTQDKIELQLLFGEDWFSRANERLDRFDAAFIASCVQHGAKRAGEPAKVDLDELEDNGVPLAAVAERILDALYISMFGRTWLEHIEFLSKKFGALTEGDDAPPQ